MITAAIFATAWICLLIGVVAGLPWHAYWLAGQVLLTRRFLVELLTVALVFSVLICGWSLASAALGECL